MNRKSGRLNSRRKSERRRSRLSKSRELLASGLAHHQAGRLVEAERCYREACTRSPHLAEAAHLLGRVLYELRRPDEALPWLEQSVACKPDSVNALNDLGNLLEELGRKEDAEAAYRRVVQLQPDNADAYNNLGVVLKESGRADEAIEAYQQAIVTAPKHPFAHCNLGNLLRKEDRLEEAAVAYRRALQCNSQQTDAHKGLCATLSRLEDWEQAAEACQQWLANEPDNPVARHMMAAFSEESAPTRASEAYVVGVFDEFAATFDQQLARLNYRGPQWIAETLAEEGLAPVPVLNILDAGCGTGLCGPILKPYARRLVGVDLSKEMVRKAHQRNVYDELAIGELTAFIAAHSETFDLIVCADTLIYFGDLNRVVAAVCLSLRPEGRFVFTLEQMPAAEEGNIDYRLNRHGRYTHSRNYVHDCLAKGGMRPLQVKCEVLREQASQPVGGLLVTAIRV